MSLRGAQRLRGAAEANPEIPRVARNRLRNPMNSSTYKIRDCFAPLAMTTLGAFYETINFEIRNFGTPL